MAGCSSTENKSSIPVDEKVMQCYLYPPPIARFEDVTVNPKLFMDTLGKFHAAMGTKFMIPIVGGKDLDLHHLFVEVTSRGGIKRVLEEKKWKEVTNSFNFPPSATNASFIIRKYYMSLIHHFEQVYYFKAKAWTPVSNDTWQSTKSALTSTSGMNRAVLPLTEFQMDPTKPQRTLSAETQATSMKRQRTAIEDTLPEASPEPSIGFPVRGIIDGKFDSGYLCTVMIGGEPLQGVLYQSTGSPSNQAPKHHAVVTSCQTTSGNTTLPSRMVRRRRRKKSEMKKRDPAHPKPNRSGYNFFFAEQHARLKPLHPGKDRDISRMIGELWNNLTESKKTVYQEKAMKDKERYRIEMEQYRESLRTGRLVSNAVPLLQQPFKQDLHMMEFNEALENDHSGSPQTPENELTSACSDRSSFENEVKTADKDSNFGLPMSVEVGSEIVRVETVSSGQTKTVIGGDECSRDIEMDPKNDLLFVKESDQPTSMAVQDNEPVITETVSTQDNESNHDGNAHCDEPTMPDIKHENETKYQLKVKFDGTVEQLTSETKVQYEPEPLNPKEPVAINENLDQD